MKSELRIELVESPSPDLVEFFDRRIEEFNVARWEIKEKKPICVRVKDSSGRIVAGAAAKTFGMWLLIDNLWVAEDMRGRDLGSEVLRLLESGAKNRGCRYALLDTLNFQARPFYEKHGYSVQWVQPSYPRDGHKYFMTRDLAKNPRDPKTPFTLYAILLNKTQGRELSKDAIQRHVEHLRNLDKAGHLVLCGPFTDAPAGMVIVRAKDKAEATAFAENDPFVQEGYRTFEVRSWLIASEANGFLE